MKIKWIDSNSQRTSYSLFDTVNFYKGIYSLFYSIFLYIL